VNHFNPYYGSRFTPAAPAQPDTTYTGPDAEANRQRDLDNYAELFKVYEKHRKDHDKFLKWEAEHQAAIATASTPEAA